MKRIATKAIAISFSAVLILFTMGGDASAISSHARAVNTKAADVGKTEVSKQAVSAKSNAVKLPAVQKKPPTTRNRPKGGGCGGPDLEVVSLVITRGINGQINAMGTVRNSGENFSSAAGQAAIVIRAYNPAERGAAAYTIVTEVPITSMGAGAVRRVTGSYALPDFASFDREPDATDECPFEVQLFLSVDYDPDIYNDGNDNNDDCNSSNNQTDRAFGYFQECVH